MHSKMNEDTIASRVGSRRKRKPEKIISSIEEIEVQPKRKHVKLSKTSIPTSNSTIISKHRLKTKANGAEIVGQTSLIGNNMENKLSSTMMDTLPILPMDMVYIIFEYASSLQDLGMWAAVSKCFRDRVDQLTYKAISSDMETRLLQHVVVPEYRVGDPVIVKQIKDVEGKRNKITWVRGVISGYDTDITIHSNRDYSLTLFHDGSQLIVHAPCVENLRRLLNRRTA